MTVISVANDMKFSVTMFKSVAVALKKLEPFVRNGQHLQTGRGFKRFGDMRSREALANWLLCAAVNHFAKSDRLTFTSDPIGGDGIILDTATHETWPTEHVYVPPTRDGRIQTPSILAAGPATARGRLQS